MTDTTHIPTPRDIAACAAEPLHPCRISDTNVPGVHWCAEHYSAAPGAVPPCTALVLLRAAALHALRHHTSPAHAAMVVLWRLDALQEGQESDITPVQEPVEGERSEPSQHPTLAVRYEMWDSSPGGCGTSPTLAVRSSPVRGDETNPGPQNHTTAASPTITTTRCTESDAYRRLRQIAVGQRDG